MVDALSSYAGKRVLVTGHTGFKGAWLGYWLSRLGAEVHGLALDPLPEQKLFAFVESAFSSDIRCDIRDREKTSEAIAAVEPEIVFHLAAQPIVLESYRDPITTIETNVMGTAHVLEAIRSLSQVCHAVVVTSDKCYRNQEWEFAYRETDPLGGKDVYSASKAAAEIVTAAWESSFFSGEDRAGRVVTARGGNVIGGGDFSDHRIVPDAMKAFAGGEVLSIRNPQATRPWQHVLDCLGGYLVLGSRLGSDDRIGGECLSFNFGPTAGSHRTVHDLIEEIRRFWPGDWRDASGGDQPHEASRLAVAIDRAAFVLGWRPAWEFSEAVEHTVSWYRSFYEDDGKTLDLMSQQITRYEECLELSV